MLKSYLLLLFLAANVLSSAFAISSDKTYVPAAGVVLTEIFKVKNSNFCARDSASSAAAAADLTPVCENEIRCAAPVIPAYALIVQMPGAAGAGVGPSAAPQTPANLCQDTPMLSAAYCSAELLSSPWDRPDEPTFEQSLQSIQHQASVSGLTEL